MTTFAMSRRLVRLAKAICSIWLGAVRESSKAAVEHVLLWDVNGTWS